MHLGRDRPRGMQHFALRADVHLEVHRVHRGSPVLRLVLLTTSLSERLPIRTGDYVTNSSHLLG